MKKRMMVAAGLLALSLTFTGCSKKATDDNVTISQYKGVEVEMTAAAEVTDEDVEAEIQTILESNAIQNEVTDRPVQEGDTATIDYEGKIDGVAFEGGSSTDYPLKIGSGSFIEGFESGIVGHSIGETFDLDLTFPEDYGNADYAGKAAVFTVTIKSINVSTTPELTDEFVKTVSEESTTVEEYKKEVKKNLEKNREESVKSSLKQGAWSAVMENTEVKNYPEDRLKETSDQIKDQYQSLADSYGMEFSEFLTTYMGMDEETFNSQLEEAAKSQLKQMMAMDLIIEAEKLDVSEKALEKKYEEFVEYYGFESLDEIKKEASEEELKNMAKLDIVQEFLADNCKQVEASEGDAAK